MMGLFDLQAAAASENAYTLFPIEQPRLWQLYKQAEASFWTAEELDLTHDRRDFDGLSDAERHFVCTVLAFFAASDGIVNENLALNFAAEVPFKEAKCFYGFQIAMENIHSEVYSLLIDTYVRDTEQKARLLNAIETIPCVQQKARWCFRYLSRDSASFVERLLAFICVEGIFFSGSFCSIFWLKKRSLMPGLALSNEFISRDEGLHCQFGVALYGMLRPEHRLPESRVHEIVGDAVSIEKSFVRDALPVSLIGMNEVLMCEYIEFVADFWLRQLGYGPLFGRANPFDWMNMISVEGKTNFFERRVSEYSKANVGAASSARSTAFSESEEF